MKFIADLHLHSKYSRATSPKMNIRELSDAAKVKGLNLLSAGDFTHPKHFSDLKQDLQDAGNGFYTYNNTYFILTTEVANIYSQDGKVRKVHNVLFAPSLEVVEQMNDELVKWTKNGLDYDGRPIFGRTSIELLDLCLGISKDIELIPAHVWTPWFGIFGSKSGFDSVEECFAEKSKHIHALETGLSSDPAMNWRLSALDKYTLLSFSDAHSPYPWRLGREATVFDLNEPSYFEMLEAIRKKDSKKVLSTIEFFPEEGKYHYDGHRNCNVSLSPTEAKKYNDICPVCRRPLTIGVLHRVEELADRPDGFKPKDAIPFQSLIPLSELIASLFGTDVATKRVWQESNKLIEKFGTELDILLNVPVEELNKITGEKIADVIIKNRNGQVEVKPGYDGVYGKPVFTEEEKTGANAAPLGQKTLGEF